MLGELAFSPICAVQVAPELSVPPGKQVPPTMLNGPAVKVKGVEVRVTAPLLAVTVTVPQFPWVPTTPAGQVIAEGLTETVPLTLVVPST